MKQSVVDISNENPKPEKKRNNSLKSLKHQYLETLLEMKHEEHMKRMQILNKIEAMVDRSMASGVLGLMNTVEATDIL